MGEIKMAINEQMRLIHEDEDKFIFETIRTYTDGVLAHEGIIKIPNQIIHFCIVHSTFAFIGQFIANIIITSSAH